MKSNPDRIRSGRTRRTRLLIPGIPTAALIGGLALTSGVALTASSGWLIVAASFRPQILTLMAVIVLVRAFGVARPLLRYVERIRSHDAALAFLAEQRALTYDRLVPLTPARLGRRSRGDLLAGVVDDLDDLANAQVRVAVPIVALLVAGIAAAVLDSIILIHSGLVILSAVCFALLVGVLDWRLELRWQQDVVTARARVGELSTLLGSQGHDLAAIGASDQALGWLADAQVKLQRALTRQAWGRALGVGLSPLVAAAHAVAMAFVVQPWVAAGMATPLAALLVLTPIALGEVVSGVPDAVGALARAQGSARRLDALLAQEPAVADADVPAPEPGTSPVLAAAQPPAVVTRELSASWDRTRPAVHLADLDVTPGSFVGIIGPNGCGKSTLLAVLARHLDPRTGTYRVGDVDALATPPAAVRTQLAIVDDETHVFASTVRENLRLASPAAPDEAILRALRLAGLSPWFETLPTGLDERLGANGRGVSGGERARLGLARALVSERPVLLLDEPVAHLDHPSAVAVLGDLLEARHGRSVVLVTHRSEGLSEADTVIDLGD
ncbi:thiol reductant ABC exporter subunit CydC [Gephyromycinifex aptenodytis]|uniref:thiol reductant ABC exporter subunit CydC n=1 Tax=Gephyromycinifex aptenodytis TaxID=2716227 RepID=UPI001444ED99|nr:thiol reductant ABC exporter subunit CydC [Gephyromycinifex aptenodytis]